MIYGDNPQKINEREDKLGLKTYSYAPQISAVVQSGNLYVYAVSNPVMYADEDGEFALTTAKLLAAAGHGLFNGITKYIEYKDTGKNALVGFAFGFAGGFVSSFFEKTKIVKHIISVVISVGFSISESLSDLYLSGEEINSTNVKNAIISGTVNGLFSIGVGKLLSKGYKFVFSGNVHYTSLYGYIINTKHTKFKSYLETFFEDLSSQVIDDVTSGVVDEVITKNEDKKKERK